jgi:hypothetical protein
VLPDGCCCLNNTGNKILFRINWQCVNRDLMWSHMKSIGVRSSDLEGQAIGQPPPFQQSFKWWWDVDSDGDLISLINGAAGSWHFWAHISLCCVVGCVLRLVAICLNTCSKLVWNTVFSKILQRFC